MGMLDALMGGKGETPSSGGVGGSVLDSVSKVSETAGQTLSDSLKKMESEAQASLAGGASHEELMAEMRSREASKSHEYEVGA